MLTAGASTLLLLSVTFAGNAVRSLQGADWVSITPVEAGLGAAAGLPRRADRHPPDARGADGAGWSCSTVYVLGAAWVFAIKPWRRRTAEAVGA